MIELRPMTPADAFRLGPRLRDIDKRELELLVNPVSPERALMDSLNVSAVALVGEIDGQVEMAGGVVDEGTFGNCWVVCSPVATQNPFDFCKTMKALQYHLARKWPWMRVVSPKECEDHHRWIEFMGLEKFDEFEVEGETIFVFQGFFEPQE